MKCWEPRTFRLTFIPLGRVAIALALMLLSRPAGAQQQQPAWWASDRSVGGSTTNLTVGTLAITVSVRPTNQGPRQVHLSVQNRGDTRLADLSIRLFGRNARCDEPEITSVLDAGERQLAMASCTREVSALVSDAAWDLNEPLAVVVGFTSGEVRRTETIPVGYLRYAGWPTSFSPDDTGILLMLMSRAPAPALDSTVRAIRAQAESAYGFPIDGSAASRVSVARAVGQYVLESRLRYAPRGDAYVGPWPSGGTTNFPAETIAYGRGACDDFAVLAGFFLHALDVPYAILSSPGHAATLVELARGHEIAATRAALPTSMHDLVIESSCGSTRCLYLPLDLSQVRAASTTDAILAASRAMWSNAVQASEGFVLVPSWQPVRRPPGTLLGRSWLGESPNVRLHPGVTDEQTSHAATLSAGL